MSRLTRIAAGVGNKSLEDAETRVRGERDRLLREDDWEIVKASEARMRGNRATLMRHLLLLS